MKRNIIFGVLLLALIYCGSVFMGHVSAQQDVPADISASPDTMATQPLPFSQNWTDVALITVDDSWSGVPGIVGFRGDDGLTTTPSDIDPRTVTQDLTGTPVDVNANRSDPDAFATGGIAEFDGIPNPVVAMQGSGTADFPNIVLYLNTNGRSNVQVAFNARDIDAGSDVVQQLNVQYRIGPSGPYTNVNGGYFADVTAAGATMVTPVSVTLPGPANNQPSVEVRIMTTNATGSDEFIGIDDISVTGTTGGTFPVKRLFTARLNSTMEVPTNASTGTGYGRVVLNDAETQITASFYWNGLTSGTVSGHIHSPGPVGVNGPVLFNLNPATGLTSGSRIDQTFAITPAQVADLRAGIMYFNIHTTNFPGGEIRGQILYGQADAPLDFNGDGKTDFGVTRASFSGVMQVRWYNLLNTATPTTLETDFGTTADDITPGDYDGDGKDDIAVWRPEVGNSRFFILQSSTNTVRVVKFGLPDDDSSVVADYDGDGIDDPAIYRRGDTPGAQSQFWWFGSNGVTKNAQVVINWGAGADVAAPGDYTGDGRADYCVYRSVSPGGRGIFFVHPSTGAYDAVGLADTATPFGLFSSDIVVPGDYDGDGRTDFAVTRREGTILVWYYLPSSGGPFAATTWGVFATDNEVQGDYDGDGRTDLAVWRSTTPSTFYVLKSAGGVQYQSFGVSTDNPSALDTHP